MMRSSANGGKNLVSLIEILWCLMIFIAVLLASCMQFPKASVHDFSTCKGGVFCELFKKYQILRSMPLDDDKIAKEFYKNNREKTMSQITDLFITNNGRCKDETEERIVCLVDLEWRVLARDSYARCYNCVDKEDNCLPPCLQLVVIEYEMLFNNGTLSTVSFRKTDF